MCQVFTESALISGYAKARDSTRRVFDENPNRGLGSWNAFISGFSQGAKEALTLFHELRRHGTVPDHLARVSFVLACFVLGDVGLSEQMHKCVLQF